MDLMNLIQSTSDTIKFLIKFVPAMYKSIINIIGLKDTAELYLEVYRYVGSLGRTLKC